MRWDTFEVIFELHHSKAFLKVTDEINTRLWKGDDKTVSTVSGCNGAYAW